MQPRNSPLPVRSVTRAPAGRRRSWSNSPASHPGARPACATSMASRAIRRSRCLCVSLSTIDEHEIPGVNDQPENLRDDEHRVFFVNCVGQRDGAAEDREPPEDERDVGLAAALRGDPLHEEARAEDGLPEEAEGEPKRIETHSSSFTL